MKRPAFLLLCCVSLFASAQTSNNNIVIGKIDSVYSRILGEERKIWVYVPNASDNAIFSGQRYPVVYLLDGDGHFYSVMGMIQQLSEVNGNTVCPEMIVVGIPNTDRTRDLTPTHAAASPYMDSNFIRTSGGGENFTSFLQKELIPHIDSLYPTAPYRMLIGHSFGGLTAVNILINHTDLFNSYIAIDPSLWWDDQKLLKQSGTVLQQKNFNGKHLYLAIANTMSPGMDTESVKKDTANATIHIRSILQFAHELASNKQNGLQWSYRYYGDDNHGSVPLIAEYDGLHFMFSSYRIPGTLNLFDSTMNVDSALTSHFKEVSRQMGYEVLPPESMINGLGYFNLQTKNFKRAYTFFAMNIKNYPRSFNVYDSMGDYYDAKGDKQKAIEYYTKALALKEFPDTRKKLESLKAKK